MTVSAAAPSLALLVHHIVLNVQVNAMAPPTHLLKQKLMAKALPDTGEPWTSLPNGIEYQPAANLSPLAQKHLRRLTEDEMSVGIFEKMFVDGAETYYDEYAQAWRALGFYIDCDYQGDGHRRELQEGEGSGCQRFMLWAAYVDEEYSGNGVGEYMYYDRNKNYWDDRTCAFENSDRCVKMDCHLPNTHFSLLGFFKEPGYGDWFEQLFKHEGDCVWTDEEYRFMQSFREVWPERCTEAGTFPNTNSSLFYDIKPSMYGEMEIGLYTDTNCIQEYQGSYTAEKAMRELVCSGQVEAGDEEGIDIADLCAIGQANMITALTVYKKGSNYTSDEEEHHDERGDLWGLVSQVEKWNRAFDVYKQCQPCKTYDLTNIVAGKNYQKSYDHIRYNWTSAAMWDRDNGEGDEGEEFRCHDAAGYDNVNQCMKFQTKTGMMTAHWNDVQMAVTQGSVAALTFPGADKQFHYSKNGVYTYKVNIGKRFSQQDEDFFVFITSFVVMVTAALLFGCSLYRYKTIKDEADEMMKEPLIVSTGISA